MRRSLAAVTLSLGVVQSQVPIEHGTIAWSSSYATARADAIAARKPLLVVFQEVPG